MKALVIGKTYFGNRQNDRYRLILRLWPFVFDARRQPSSRLPLNKDEVLENEFVFRFAHLTKIPDWSSSI